jgi:hypothetical protein
MRALRGINPWTAVPLLVVAVLLGFLGGLQLTRALPAKPVVERGSVVSFSHDPGGRYSGESWNVLIDVPGHSPQIADSHALYKVVERADPLALPAVTVHLRGSLVTEVDVGDNRYKTTAVSSTEAWIEAVVLLALCALTLAGLVRTVRRDTRASHQPKAAA